MDGWIKLHRKSEDNELYFLEPFTKRQAWQDLILTSNHKDGKIIVRGIIINLKRSQNGYSQETLAKRWKRSRGKVKRFLNYLETIQQIVQQTVQQNNKLKTIITIINYEKYQGNDTTNDTTNGHQTDIKQYSNKNDNNNIYNNIGDKSPEFGNSDINIFLNDVEAIYDKLGVACDLSNRKYANHWITKNGLAKTKLEFIEKHGYNDVYEFIEDIIKRAKLIKYGNHIANITNLYGLWKKAPEILNLTKKEANIQTKNPTTFEDWIVDITGYKNRVDIIDDDIKYAKIVGVVKFLKSIGIGENTDKKKELAKKVKDIFGEQLYKKVWSEIN